MYNKNISPVRLWFLITLISLTLAPVYGDSNLEDFRPDVKMIDVYYFRDGGTTGFAAEVDGTSEQFCLDGRAVSAGIAHPQWHVFLDATHPTKAGAKKVAIGGKEEARIITILSAWINSELSATEQNNFVNEGTFRTDRHKAKLWRAMNVRDRLMARQILANSVMQPAKSTSNHAAKR